MFLQWDNLLIGMLQCVQPLVLIIVYGQEILQLVLILVLRNILVLVMEVLELGIQVQVLVVPAAAMVRLTVLILALRVYALAALTILVRIIGPGVVTRATTAATLLYQIASRAVRATALVMEGLLVVTMLLIPVPQVAVVLVAVGVT